MTDVTCEPAEPACPASPTDHELITVAETARILGFSHMTIRRRIASRQFPAVRIGRKSMIPRAFVMELLAAARSGRTVVVEELTSNTTPAPSN
ncbi:MAG: helix-turn-helix domain-containing protein [Actinomycetales bacterium]|nr:helix-turn-helix domain-containing protein [Actinomycetales bacterium]